MKRRSFLLNVSGYLSFSLAGLLPDRAVAQVAGYDVSVIDMVETASRLIEDHGLSEAIENSAPDTWIKPGTGIYVFVLDAEGYLRAHPQSQTIGANIRGIRDVDGFRFIESILNALTVSGDTVWTEYYWSDPVEGRVRHKRVYSKKVGELIVNCGYYMDTA